MVDTNTPIAGAQSVRRALQLLRNVGLRHEAGVSVAELVQVTRLERPTVHRLVSCLVEEGFVDRIAGTRRYRLGHTSMNLGLVSLRRVPVLEQCRAALQRIARIAGDTVFLVVRQDDHALCLHRQEGPYPIKVFTIDIGERRLLGIGAGGLALMATLSDDEIQAIHRRNREAYEGANLGEVRLQRLLAATRRKGFAETVNSITEGVAGVGVSLELNNGARIAVSIGAIGSRLGSARRAALAEVMMRELRDG